MDDVLQRFKNTIQDKNLSFELKVKQPSTIFSDLYYVDLILENIISNAIKYSPLEGKIKIAIFPDGEKTICQIYNILKIWKIFLTHFSVLMN